MTLKAKWSRKQIYDMFHSGKLKSFQAYSGSKWDIEDGVIYFEPHWSRRAVSADFQISFVLRVPNHLYSIIDYVILPQQLELFDD